MQRKKTNKRTTEETKLLSRQPQKMEMKMRLVGLKNEVQDALDALNRRQPVLFYGPTGCGKTLAAWKVAKKLSKQSGLPILYLQLYPEMTKNSLIGGETIKKGSIVVEKQPLLSFGERGAIIIVDECTHTTEPVILSFNSLIEEPYQTVVGEEICTLNKNTRFIFCGNTPDHAGNIHLPASFANRLYIISVPAPDEETLVKIGTTAAPKAPKEILSFVAKLITSTHEPSFPVSPRNMVTASRSVQSLLDSGYKKSGKRLPSKNVEELMKSCEEFNIDTDRLRRSIKSSLMAHVVAKTMGPDKVTAQLW